MSGTMVLVNIRNVDGGPVYYLDFGGVGMP